MSQFKSVICFCWSPESNVINGNKYFKEFKLSKTPFSEDLCSKHQLTPEMRLQTFQMLRDKKDIEYSVFARVPENLSKSVKGKILETIETEFQLLILGDASKSANLLEFAYKKMIDKWPESLKCETVFDSERVAGSDSDIEINSDDFEESTTCEVDEEEGDEIEIFHQSTPPCIPRLSLSNVTKLDPLVVSEMTNIRKALDQATNLITQAHDKLNNLIVKMAKDKNKSKRSGSKIIVPQVFPEEIIKVVPFQSADEVDAFFDKTRIDYKKSRALLLGYLKKLTNNCDTKTPFVRVMMESLLSKDIRRVGSWPRKRQSSLDTQVIISNDLLLVIHEVVMDRFQSNPLKDSSVDKIMHMFNFYFAHHRDNEKRKMVMRQVRAAEKLQKQQHSPVN